MVSSSSKPLSPELSQIVLNALDQGILHRRDYLKLTAAMLSQTNLTADDRSRINKLFDQVRSGQIHLIT